MLRSMYSAISGMQGFETKLDVVGNNIANVNTTGYKASRVDFSDLLSQTIAAASAPSGNMGGTNPEQVGLGLKIAGIQTLFTQGADQNTGNPLDCAINGSGLFAVSPDGGTTKYYTRAGNFEVDASGYLTLPNGMRVLSSSGLTINIPTNPGSVTIDQNGNVKYVDNTGTTQTARTIGLATCPNPAGLTKVGDTLYAASSNSGTVTLGAPSSTGAGTLMPGALEMSNVDLTQEFTEMIVAQRGFDANSHVIGTANAILQDIVNLKNS
ncbi:MAG: flagellar basal-body rod protein FlgF [Alicyclobacillus sp.]|nr:flagellar basal-body rod protein FlgF [Alicyclobacillus sp.]